MAPKKRRAQSRPQSRPPFVKTVRFEGELLDGHALDSMIADCESKERLQRLRSAKQSLTTNYIDMLPAELRRLVLAQLLLHAERPAGYACVCTAWLSDWRDKQLLQQECGSTSQLPRAGTFLQPCGQSLLLTGRLPSTWLSMPTNNTFLINHAACPFADFRLYLDEHPNPIPFAERRIQGAAFSSDGSTVYLIEWSDSIPLPRWVVKLRLQSPTRTEGLLRDLFVLGKSQAAEYRQVAAKQVGTPEPGPGIALDESAGQVIVPLRAAGSHGEHVVLLDLDLKVLGHYPHAGVPKKDHFEDGVQTAAVSGGRIAVADSYLADFVDRQGK